MKLILCESFCEAKHQPSDTGAGAGRARGRKERKEVERCIYRLLDVFYLRPPFVFIVCHDSHFCAESFSPPGADFQRGSAQSTDFMRSTFPFSHSLRKRGKRISQSQRENLCSFIAFAELLFSFRSIFIRSVYLRCGSRGGDANCVIFALFCSVSPPPSAVRRPAQTVASAVSGGGTDDSISLIKIWI